MQMISSKIWLLGMTDADEKDQIVQAGKAMDNELANWRYSYRRIDTIVELFYGGHLCQALRTAGLCTASP